MKKIITILAFSLLTLLCACGGGNSADIVVPPPTVLRTDLLFGYYGGSPQVLETLDHTNLLFESGLYGQEAQLNVIEAAKQPTIIDVDSQVYIGPVGSNREMNPNIRNNLRNRFTEMRNRDLLKYVIGIYPIDEPDNNVYNEKVIREVNSEIRLIVSEFPELANVKLVAIYAHSSRLLAMDTYDWVGFDHYDNTSGIFANGEYANLVSKLGPNQRTVIVPGGAYGQDIVPFLNFAETHSEVAAIIPFIWFDNWEPGAKGIRSNGMATSYCQAGMQIKYPTEKHTCM